MTHGDSSSARSHRSSSLSQSSHRSGRVPNVSVVPKSSDSFTGLLDGQSSQPETSANPFFLSSSSFMNPYSIPTGQSVSSLYLHSVSKAGPYSLAHHQLMNLYAAATRTQKYGPDQNRRFSNASEKKQRQSECLEKRHDRININGIGSGDDLDGEDGIGRDVVRHDDSETESLSNDFDESLLHQLGPLSDDDDSFVQFYSYARKAAMEDPTMDRVSTTSSLLSDDEMDAGIENHTYGSIEDDGESVRTKCNWLPVNGINTRAMKEDVDETIIGASKGLRTHGSNVPQMTRCPLRNDSTIGTRCFPTPLHFNYRLWMMESAKITKASVIAQLRKWISTTAKSSLTRLPKFFKGLNSVQFGLSVPSIAVSY